MDSSIALKLIKSNELMGLGCKGLVSCIRLLLNRSWQVMLSHSLHEDNRLVDCMTTSLSIKCSKDFVLFEHPPAVVALILAAGQAGVA
ncbi:conserved hypothetical protein [Ricinus communis]|uniref:RNase H type-1 domain-containing protein n=1 Tax=Ricinus communis TaxID=3988 RepID=B9S8J0_RICCO|nr:conserved hypothetical protein [Ricinus communis]